MPVESQYLSGVVVVSSGSRMTSFGPEEPSIKGCLREVSSCVPPARSEYSPPEREVGMEMMGILAEVFREGVAVCVTSPVVKVARSSNVFASFARACEGHMSLPRMIWTYDHVSHQ
jgi:hypothetical protein